MRDLTIVVMFLAFATGNLIGQTRAPKQAVPLGDLPSDVPVFIVRSGRDEFQGLNQAMARFVAAAIARNLPMTVVNHPTAQHGFELNDDNGASRCLIRQMLAFMRFSLTGNVAE